MITIRELALQFGERFLFNRINATIGARDAIGLVGSNGAGKSTLLKILANQESPDSGTIDKARYVTIGYLPQDGIEFGDATLFEEVKSSFDNVVDLQRNIDEASARLHELDTASEEYRETLELIGTWEQELDDLDAAKLPSRIESILLGLGFSIDDMERATNEFSGGWQMRIALAKLLLAQPSLLLLDEPTNHLDITSQRWLETFLRKYQGSLLMVSHDRAFLDELTNRTFELTLGKLNVYRGNYTRYESESVARKEQQVRAFKNQQSEIEKTQKFIDRFRAKSTKATQVQSRIKALDKIERIEIEQEEDQVSFSFPPAPRSGQVVIEVENLCKSYGPISVIKGANLRLERGDRIGVVGVNGAGKTTLAKILAGVEPYQSGELKVGHNVSLSYFAQHQAEELEPDAEVLESLERAGTGMNATQLRSVLGAFLFRGDDVFKKVKVLSGGERNRLALAKMLARPCNLLILDEPTNHLDMRSQEALRKALSEFEGAFLIVSHNRAFMDSIVTKVLEVRKDGLSLFPGNVSDYLRHVEFTESKSGESTHSIREKPQSESPKERRKRRAQIVKELSPQKTRLKEIEALIASNDTTQREIENRMAESDFYKNAKTAKATMDEYQNLKSMNEALYEEWDTLSDKIAEKESALETLS